MQDSLVFYRPTILTKESDRRLNVLIIEDDPKIGGLLVRLLEKWKMGAVLVADCDEARTALLETSVDFLVADLVPNGSSSLDLIQELRDSERHENLPILMVAGEAGKAEILAASQAGVDGFLAKPFDPPQLQKKIHEVRRTKLRQLQDHQVREMWKTRTTYVNNLTTSHLIFGEPIESEEELVHPSNRNIKSHLVTAWAALKECNEELESLKAGHVIESRTTDIVLHLKKESALEWVKALFLSCHCTGNVTVIARILRMNRGDSLPIYLIYDQAGELPEAQAKGLKKLGIKIARRQKLAEKMDSLVRLHLTGKTGKKAEKAKVTALTPSAVKARVIADIETMTKLPPLPQVYEKITKLARDPKSDMKDWVKAVEVEPMTCATILKHANSSALGFTAEVTNIERAVVLLGKNTVAGLVAGEAVRKSFTAVEDNGFKLEEFWLHNMAVGYTSHLLSLEVNADADGPQGESIASAGLDEEAEEVLRGIDLPSRLKLPKGSPCFIAGTMHDIGKGVIVQSYPGLFPVLLEELEEKKWMVPMLEAERVVAGGLTHPLAGELLMRSWGLAGQLGSVVLSHHQPEHDDHLTFLVGVADVVGQVLYPFPAKSAYPLAAAIDEGSLTDVKAFLPEGFLDQPMLSSAELVSIVQAVRTRVKEFVEETRQAVSS